MIRPDEQKATLAAFVLAFILMATYFVLRPVRDAMASDWSDTEVSVLWNIQLFVSVALVSLYGLAVSRLQLRFVVPALYSTFALSFLAFYLIAPMIEDPTWLEKVFYLWVAAFSLFNLSVFWSLMADVFDDEQGKRLFAIIAAGAAAGAMIGPVVPTLLSARLGLDTLMLIASAGLFLVLPLVVYLQRPGKPEPSNSLRRNKPIGGHSLAGFWRVARNPQLRGISVFILLYVFVGSIVYFEQKNILAAYDRVERVQILGGIDWIVNSLTFAVGFLLSGRLLKRLGTGVSLALIPIALVIGLAALAFAPIAAILICVQIVRRVGNYALTRPARETLFTKVSAEDRFKAKPVIDVVVYRGGDAATGTVFAFLTEGIGLTLTAVSLLGACVATVWSVVGLRLGSKHDRTNSLTNNPIPQQEPQT